MTLITCRIATLWAVFFLAAGRAVAVPAIVVVDQPPGVHSNEAYFSNGPGAPGNPGYRVADDFQLATNALITEVQWWGKFNVGSTEDFSFAFYNDAGGFPAPYFIPQPEVSRRAS